jgi:hypothetical protein
MKKTTLMKNDPDEEDYLIKKKIMFITIIKKRSNTILVCTS